jgi:dihydrodipicolinate synthase/N-acetylneuraminate lyase
MPCGIVPVIDTPFDENGAVDQVSHARVIDDAIAAGATGLVGPVVASEVHALTREEREAMVRFCARAINHRVPYIVGASSSSAEESRRYAALAEEVGAEAYLVAVPDALYSNIPALIAFFRAIVDDIKTPLIIQDLQWSGPGLDIATIRQLRAALPTLVGMKVETVPAGPKYTQVREAMGKDFYITGGWAAAQLIEALDRGVNAMVPECAMVRVYATIYRAYATDSRESAIQLFRKLLPVIVFKAQEIFHSIAFSKRLMVKKGILRTAHLRPPGYSWDGFNQRIADELIDYYLELERSLD